MVADRVSEDPVIVRPSRVLSPCQGPDIAMMLLAQGCGLLIIVLSAIILVMTRTQAFDPPPTTPNGLNNPILGIELAKTADEVHALFRDPLGGHNRVVFRGQIHQDWYFIAIYTTFFIGMGTLLAFRRTIGWRLLAVAVALLAGGAAVCDYHENMGILAMIRIAPSKLTDPMAAQTRWYSLIKWGLFSAMLGPLGLVFLGRKPGKWIPGILKMAAGVLFMVASIVGLFGVFFHNPAITWSLSILSLALIAALPVLILTPEDLSRDRPGPA